MAHNLNYKLTNLKINTEMPGERIALSSKKYGSQIGMMSPLGVLNQMTSSFSPKMSKKAEEPVYPQYNSKQFSEGNTRSSSKGKSKTELTLDTKFYSGTTFSPKSTKSNYKSVSNSLNKYMPLSTRNNTGFTYNQNSKNISSLDTTKNISSPLTPNATSYNTFNTFNTFNTYNTYNVEAADTGPEVISVMSLLGNSSNIPITVKNLNATIPNYDCSKYSVKSMSVIKAYAANTHQGIIR